MKKTVKKTNWQTKKLGEVCDILDSKRKPITKRNRVSGKYPYYGATGILDYVADYIFDEKLILIGEDGAKWESGENTAFITDGKYWVNNHAHVIKPHRDIILDNWIVFFFYFNDITKYTTGLTVSKLNQTNLKQIQIPLPPLPEQKRIVGILDGVFEDVKKAKENTEKNLANAKELFESYLQSVFENPGKNWEEKKLGGVCDISIGKTPPRGDKKFWDEKKETNNIWLSIKDLNNTKGKEIFDSREYVSDKGAKLFKPVKKGILLASFKLTLGRLAFAGTNLRTNEAIAAFEIKNERKLNKEYLFYYLTFFDWYAETKGDVKVKGKTLNKAKLKEIQVLLPPLPEQKQIVKKLDELSAETKKLEKIYQQKIDDLEELKKSVLKKAFAGEL